MLCILEIVLRNGLPLTTDARYSFSDVCSLEDFGQHIDALDAAMANLRNTSNAPMRRSFASRLRKIADELDTPNEGPDAPSASA
jgi:hypothetical protein